MKSPVPSSHGSSVRPHLREIDRQVSARMRMRRMMLGLTMQHVAMMVGVTYQPTVRHGSKAMRTPKGPTTKNVL